MVSVCEFVVQFDSVIVWKLSCFDRVIFKDDLSWDGMRLSKWLVGWARSMCQQAARPDVSDRRVLGKDEWALRQLNASPMREGLIAVLSARESCTTYAWKPTRLAQRSN